MSENIRKGKIWNDCIQKKVGVASIKKKMTKTQLQWFRHVQRRLLKAPMRKVDQMIFNLVKKGKED